MPKLLLTISFPSSIISSSLPQIRKSQSYTIPSPPLVDFIGQYFLLSSDIRMATPSSGVLCSYSPAQKQPMSAFLVLRMSTRFSCLSILMLKLTLLSLLKSQINFVFRMLFPISFWMVSRRNFFSSFRVSRRSPAKMFLFPTSINSFKESSFSLYSSRFSLRSLFLLFSASSSAINLPQFTSLFSFFSFIWASDRYSPMMVSLSLAISFISYAFLASSSLVFAIFLERQHMFLWCSYSIFICRSSLSQRSLIFFTSSPFLCISSSYAFDFCFNSNLNFQFSLCRRWQAVPYTFLPSSLGGLMFVILLQFSSLCIQSSAYSSFKVKQLTLFSSSAMQISLTPFSLIQYLFIQEQGYSLEYSFSSYLSGCLFSTFCRGVLSSEY